MTPGYPDPVILLCEIKGFSGLLALLVERIIQFFKNWKKNGVFIQALIYNEVFYYYNVLCSTQIVQKVNLSNFNVY